MPADSPTIPGGPGITSKPGNTPTQKPDEPTHTPNPGNGGDDDDDDPSTTWPNTWTNTWPGNGPTKSPEPNKPDEPGVTSKPPTNQPDTSQPQPPGNTPTSLPGGGNNGGDDDPSGTPTAIPITQEPVTTQRPPGPILIGTQSITKDPNSHIVIGSQTLLPGSQIDVDGDHISAGPSGGIIINPAKAVTTPASVIVVDGKTITAGPDGGFPIGSQTLSVGGAVTNDGAIITLPDPNATKAPLATQIVLGDATITGTSGQFVLGKQTLTQGGKITSENGDVISLSPDGKALIINAVEPATTMRTATALLVPEVISSLDIAGQTLTAGGRITVGGDILSLAPSGTGVVVIGTVTVGPDAKKTNAAAPNGYVVKVQTSFVVLAAALLLV